MIVWACGLGMWVGKFSSPVSGVGVQAMPDEGLDTMWHVVSVLEDSPGAGELRLIGPSLAVGVRVYRRNIGDRMEATCWVISAMRELFSENEGVEFGPWIVDSTELPPLE